MYRRVLFSLHKILGRLLCVLFLTWFLSGFVMIYHRFPWAHQIKIEKQQVICGNLPDIENVVSSLPDTARIQWISLDMHFDRPAFYFDGMSVPPNLYADTFQPLEDINDAAIEKTVVQWCQSPVLRVDTLRKLDQWIPFGNLKRELPVYKYTFADNEKHELYIASQSGNVLQYTDKNQRLWAWLGIIPHRLYFYQIRQNDLLWINFSKWISGITCIMCLSGMLLGLQLYWRNQRKGFASPYKKRWHYWHHVSGLIFGIFAITFSFSGMMSVANLPDWLIKKPKVQQETAQQISHHEDDYFLSLAGFALDYRKVVEDTEGIKRIEWKKYQNLPYYRIEINNKTIHIDASYSHGIRPFVMTEDMVRKNMRQMNIDSANYTLELITEYDNDYFARKKNGAPLPLYRVVVDDEMHTRHYYNPETLTHFQMDDNTRLRRFLFGGLHMLNIKPLTDRPVLWNIVMFILLNGGSFLSLTGVVLFVKWLFRKLKKCLD